MEGSTIYYYSDRGGINSTTTGEYYEGQAYNYFNFVYWTHPQASYYK